MKQSKCTVNETIKMSQNFYFKKAPPTLTLTTENKNNVFELFLPNTKIIYFSIQKGKNSIKFFKNVAKYKPN